MMMMMMITSNQITARMILFIQLSIDNNDNKSWMSSPWWRYCLT